MVAAARRGMPLRAVARLFRVSLLTVQRWVQRARGQRVDRVDWTDRPSRPHRSCRTPPDMEDRVLRTRTALKHRSILGEYGATAIRQALLAQRVAAVPSLRTIGRILERRGALDGLRRIRRPAPPRGWYLPDVARGACELESFDIIEGLVIQGGPQVDVLTSHALHSSLVGAWPTDGLTARRVSDLLIAHWRQSGLPTYAQFDNDTRFQGPHQHRDAVGLVIRLCLSLRIIPVFVPPRETGFQAAIENFNGRWQTKLWTRYHHVSLVALQTRSARYVAACRQRAVAARDGAPARRQFPVYWHGLSDAPLGGRLIYLRRTNDHGEVRLLGRVFPVARLWPHRLVRCEVIQALRAFLGAVGNVLQGVESFNGCRHVLNSGAAWRRPLRSSALGPG